MTKLYTLVHCLCDGQVLLMQRHKEPNLGLWVAPGGKIEALMVERVEHTNAQPRPFI